jgi:toxin ParE1/3/4
VATLIWAAEAVRWLEEIHDYIARDNPEAAHRAVSGIYDRAQVLLEFPEIGPRYPHNPTVRLLLQGHYRIAYSVDEDRSVTILGVFHDALPIDRYLR